MEAILCLEYPNSQCREHAQSLPSATTKKVRDDYEEAKDFFLRQMMTTWGEERDRAECVYIQLIHGLEKCSDEDE